MTPFPQSSVFLQIARRVVWFEAPADVLQNPSRFIAYAMNYGTAGDMTTIIRQAGLGGLGEALDNAPPGILDARSWAYWNTMLGRLPVPPMPHRTLAVEALPVETPALDRITPSP